MKALSLSIALLLPLLVGGQGGGKPGGQAPRRQPPVAASTAPVTQAEARAVLDRAEKLLVSLVRVKRTGAVSIASSQQAVARGQVVAEMNRIFETCRPRFKFTPRKTDLDKRPLKLKDARQMANLRKLIEWGCVAKVGPLAVGPAETLTVKQFGDSIGFFISRIAQLSHMPSPRWTPAIGGGGI